MTRKEAINAIWSEFRASAGEFCTSEAGFRKAMTQCREALLALGVAESELGGKAVGPDDDEDG